MVLLHGLLGSADNWRPVATRLAENFRVLAIDQLNHGAAPHVAALDYSRLAADVASVLRAHGVNRACVVGHSMGGKTAMQLALDFPERVGRLVVADIAPRPYPQPQAAIIRALLALELPSFTTRTQVEEALAPAIPDLFLRRFLLKNLGRDEAGKFAWKINLPGIADSYPRLCEPLTAAAAFTGPALFLRGGRSDYVTDADVPGIRELFPAAEFQTMESAGHWLHADEPEEFLRRVGEFLSG